MLIFNGYTLRECNPILIVCHTKLESFHHPQIGADRNKNISSNISSHIIYIDSGYNVQGSVAYVRHVDLYKVQVSVIMEDYKRFIIKGLCAY